MPTCQSSKLGLECWKWRPYKVRMIDSNSIHAKRDKNGPPIATHVVSIANPRCSHSILWVHPPTSPYPTISAEVEPISKGHCWKWYREAESLMTYICAMALKSSTLHGNHFLEWVHVLSILEECTTSWGEPVQVHVQSSCMHMTVIRIWLNFRPQNITQKAHTCTTLELSVRPSYNIQAHRLVQHTSQVMWSNAVSECRNETL